MKSREELILSRAEQAGLALAKKEGHMPTRDELLELKIQVVPNFVRWFCFFGSVVCEGAAWHQELKKKKLPN